MSEPGDPVLEIVVGPEQAGRRLDGVLAGPVGSRARAQRLIEAGRVLVDGSPQPKSHALRTGQQVRVADPGGPANEAPTAGAGPPAPFAVAYEDEDVIVVDKPAGVVVHPGRGHREGTLVQALAGRAAGGEDRSRPGVVHRLDRDTSGLLVVARHELAHRRLREALSRRRVEREYLALVAGRPPARTGTIEAPIGRDRRVRTRMSIDTDEPREARTHFEIERPLPSTTLLRVRLDTGRTHQIRVHLQAIGHPLCGDPEYGGEGDLGLSRQFLHACRLAFDQPMSGTPIEVLSELPEDLRGALARARGA